MRGMKVSKFTLFLWLLAAVLVVLLVVWKVARDHEEKNLADVLVEDRSDTEAISLELRGDKNLSMTSEEHGQFEQLLDFLAAYQVKKIEDSKAAEADVHNANGADLFVRKRGHSSSDQSIILEDFVYIAGSGHYRVTNGPIDMDWINKFVSENQK
ncbi:hypothetical protein NCCP2716_26920 [Sporosarcina sp. NCCP-2716]|uniref:hypothetical protein n=1 Tax=Sporosarcina sp. NCCP-2716 TaxID=2943679 RepID=UPI002041C328|nr:hypothetical protein [Sporosarcina sp. NCCP-2716]GKV70194.1 hypothetical protein NCCP2716_26920 [Sporosarcina sp. NCCP-2716]